MKKLFYLLTLAVLITACGKDDVSINTNPKAIVGNWKSTYYYFDDKDSEIDIPNYNKYSYQESIRSEYRTFLADTACGLLVWEDSDKKNIYSYTINGDKIKSTGTCEINDDHISLVVSNMKKWGIIDNKLVIAWTTYNVTVYLVFEKL
ncbi:MAG: hypothetical protein LBK94_08775 [Prevotellaceae bacterium]|jgi:hypothetical protein|nr:hypothetical protein [Prevotellaceae bacterium]